MIENFIVSNLEVTVPVMCSMEICTFSEMYVPKIPATNYSVAKMENRIVVEFNTPGAYVQTVQVVGKKWQIFESIAVDGHIIDKNVTGRTFRYYFPDIYTWKLELKMDSVPENNSITVILDSNYDDLVYSPAIQKYIKKLPDWATFKGTGTGLTVVTKVIKT